MNNQLGFTFNDGGRSEAGFTGDTGDCVVRAIAIATGIPYKQVYDDLNQLAKKHERKGKCKGISNSRTGVYRQTYQRYLESLGWKWQPTMQIGSGCQVHMRPSELPTGTIICRVSRHVVTVIDHVIQDTGNPDRGGTRCVYGYFYLPTS